MCRLPLLVAIAAVAGVLGVAEGAVDCPQPGTQKMFNADLYLGSWYEMKRVPRDYEDDGQCGMATYSWLDSSKTAVNVLNTNYIPKSMAVSSVVLRADPDDLPNGKLKVSFPNFPQITSNYWVLGTDYTNYAVVYSCAAAAPSATVPHITLWVLARDPSKYTEETDKKVMKLIESNGLDASILKTVEHHKGCPEAVCKPCASPKPNLDLAKLKSRWAVVQHSPFATDSDKQSCSLAEFTANADGLHFNTTTYQATSAEAGADKRSMLDAKWTDANKKDGSFEISAGTGPGKMCVLGTDYDNWAVVSVCLPPAPFTTAAPLGPVSVPTPAVSGGVYVLSRKRGLTPAQQMDANKCVVNAGIPAASMQTVAATPCPALALEDNTGSSAAGVTMTPAVLIASLLAAALGHLSSKQ